MSLSKLSVLAFAAIGIAQVTPQYPQNVNFIFSRGDFVTIGNKIGNEIGHSAGFTITNGDGVDLYSEGYPDNASPCAAVGDGQIFTVTSSCWDGEFKFHCKSDQYTNYENCGVVYGDGLLEQEGSIDTDTSFFGIGIALEGHCGSSFMTFRQGECPVGSTFDVHYSGTTL